MAFLEVEPPREAWPGLAPIAMVIAAVDATAFPNASRTATVGGPGMAPPAGALDGCFVKASARAAPAVGLRPGGRASIPNRVRDRHGWWAGNGAAGRGARRLLREGERAGGARGD